MRLHFLAPIVTLLALINSNAAINETNIESNTDHATSPLSSDENLDAQRQEGFERFIDLAKNFEAKYLKILANDIMGTRAIAPLGNFLSLSMFILEAKGSTRTKLMDVAGFTNRDLQNIELGFDTLLRSLNNYTKVELSVQNEIFFPLNVIPPVPKFGQLTNDCFGSPKYPCRNTNLNARSVNSYIKRYHAIAANAINFKGQWKRRFDLSRSKFHFFHIDENQRALVKNVYKHGRFRYGHLHELDSTFIEIPYESNAEEDGISMFIIRSNSQDGYKKLLNNIGTIDVEQLIRDYSKKHVRLFLPKFTIKTSTEPNQWMPQYFESSNSSEPKVSLSGLSSPPKFIFDEIQAEITVQVGGNSTETSATAEMFHRTRRIRSPNKREKITFFVDRPFVGIIATTGARSINLFTFITNGSIFKRNQRGQ